MSCDYPHNACGQILFSLKMTKLNYVVKETPFSAYITIRKKFIQSSFVPQPDVAIEKVTAAENELISLKEKNRYLETKLALITFELEETQVKNEALEKENGRLEDNIEEVLEEKRNVVKDMDKLSKTSLESNTDIKKESVKIFNENKNLKTKIRDLDTQLKDKEDSVIMLENTVSNKVSENVKLMEELKNLRRSQFPCIFCDYKTETEDDLNTHVRSMHDEKCSSCDLAFKDKKKLKDHMCQLHIKNPTRGNCYMKNWIVANGCTQIINKATMTELAILHCDDCWRRISKCADLKHIDEHDENSVYHGKLNKFIRNGVVNWSELMSLLH